VALPENSLLAMKGANQCRLGQAQVRATGGFQSARIGQAPSSNPIADLKDPKGSVLANETPAQNNMDARRDDQIATGADSRVRVVFRSCEVEVGPGEQVTVDELRERCKAGVVLTSGGDPNAEIAIIKNPQGAIMVNGGPARNNMGLKSGSQIVTGSGSSKVTLVFKACEVAVGEKEKARVGDLMDKCTGGLWADAGAGGAGGAGGGAGGAGFGIGGAGGTLVGGALLGSVGAAIAQGNDDGEGSPQ
jgi:hypothetical protein